MKLGLNYEFVNMISLSFSIFVGSQKYKKTISFCWLCLNWIKRLLIKLLKLLLNLAIISILIGIYIRRQAIYYKIQDFFTIPESEPDDGNKTDWHQWDIIREDALRTEIGEQGNAVTLLSYPVYSKEINETHGFNGYLSDQLALNRALKDFRPKECVHYNFKSKIH